MALHCLRRGARLVCVVKKFRRRTNTKYWKNQRVVPLSMNNNVQVPRTYNDVYESNHVFRRMRFAWFLLNIDIFFFQGLDKSPSNPSVENVPLKAPNATDIAGQRMDSYRFSMANLEGTKTIYRFADRHYNTLKVIIIIIIFLIDFQTLKM